MADNTPFMLIDHYLLESDLQKRLEFTQAATMGREPGDVLGVFFQALNLSVDRFQALLQIVVERSAIDRDELMASLTAKLQARASHYIEYQFNRVMQGFNDADGERAN